MSEELSIIEKLKTELGIQSDALTRKLAFYLAPDNYEYIVFYPPYKDLYTADIVPSSEILAEFSDICKSDIRKNGKRISFYFAIPWCRYKCPYCLYYSNIEDRDKADNDKKLKYIEALLNELTFYLKQIQVWRVYTIYIGGGTPGHIDIELLTLLLDGLKNKGIFEQIEELNFEIHPKDNYTQIVKVLKKYIDLHKLRISLGVQSFDDKCLPEIRGLEKEYLYSTDNVLEIVNFLKNQDINTNIDIMWGLKGINVGREFEKIRKNEIKPTTFTFYQIESPGDPVRHAKYCQKIEYDCFEIISQREYIFAAMDELGYEPVLFPAYFKLKAYQGNPIKYNTAQLDKDSHYIGLGLSGHSKLGKYSYVNTKNIDRYIELIDNKILPIDYITKLSDEDLKKREILLQLRLYNKTFKFEDLNELFSKINTEIATHEFLKSFFDATTLTKCFLTQRGQMFVDEIIRCGINHNIALLAGYDKWKIASYLNESHHNHTGKEKIEIILSFIKNSVGQVLFQEKSIEGFTANFGYTSERWETSINQQPIGLIEYKHHWQTALEEFESSMSEKFYYFSEFFKSICNIGITYPLTFEGNDFKYSYEELSNANEPTASKKLFDKLIEALHDVDAKKNLRDQFDSLASDRKLKFLEMNKLFYWYVEELDYLGKETELHFVFFKNAITTSVGGIVLVLPSNTQILDILGNITRYFKEIIELLAEAEFNEEIKKHATKSAIAAIMSRNMSHNIGSHSLTHLIGGMLDISEPEKKAFLEYIKNRMDYVAEVTTYWREMPWLKR